jgi:uncharacterized protein YchJ
MDRREFISSAQVVFSMDDLTLVAVDAESLVIDLRETPGACHGHGSSRAFEIAKAHKKIWNDHVKEMRRINAMKDGNGAIRGSLRTDRNAPCACGSGRKSKKCCGGVK